MRSLDLDVGDLAPLDHGVERGGAGAALEAGEGHVAGQVPLGRRSHGVQRALEMPALELLGRYRLALQYRPDRALEQIETPVEMLLRVDPDPESQRPYS